ncbi:MAG: hypothetical protein GXO93_03985 [FCB group bacterium]|nr:hypothetical protein [FCB group bacterium]
MRKGIIVSIVVVMLLGIFLIGCSDDNNVVNNIMQNKVLVYGYANLEPYVDFYADIMPVVNADPGIDSIVAGDSLCEFDTSYWYVLGDKDYYWAEYYNRQDSNRFSSGDTMDIKFFVGSNMVTTSVKLLSYYVDSPLYVLPVVDDTVALNVPITVIWNSVPTADWYGIRLRYRADSSGTTVYKYTYLATKDTAYTIAGSQNIYNGYYSIYVTAVTGPFPNKKISGNNVCRHRKSQSDC